MRCLKVNVNPAFKGLRLIGQGFSLSRLSFSNFPDYPKLRYYSLLKSARIVLFDKFFNVLLHKFIVSSNFQGISFGKGPDIFW